MQAEVLPGKEALGLNTVCVWWWVGGAAGGCPIFLLLTGDQRLQSPKLPWLLSMLELIFLVSERPVTVALTILCIFTINL